MRVLIIGCGYVGLALGAELAKQGHEVFGVRRSRTAEEELGSAGIRPVWADIGRRPDLAKLPDQCDWVVNCVSSTRGGPVDYREVYWEGTRNLLDHFRERSPRKFVYTSSTGVYAQDDGSIVTEESPTEPATETGKILLEAERLLLSACREREFPAVILRLAGIYGPGRGYWLKQFLANEAKIEGSGERVLNMIHRDDVCGTIVAALAKGSTGQIYNAVDDEPVKQIDLFRWLSQRLRRPMPGAQLEVNGSRSKRSATNKRVSNAKLKRELDYRFRFPSFREGYESELQRQGLLGKRN